MSLLPEGYKPLLYIESTGTQYIDMGFKPNQNTRVVCDTVFLVSASAYWLFGARNGNTDRTFGFLTYESKYRSDFNTSTDEYLTGTQSGRFTIDKNGNITKINGETAKTAAVGTFQCTHNLYLFANNSNGVVAGQSTAKIYSCQIYDNGTLVRDYIPVKFRDGSVGLLDKITDTFYGNRGTGAFIAGPDIITVPPAPEGLAANVSSGVLTLSWTASENAEGYNIYRNGEYVAATSDTTFTDTINPATTYEYGVTAHNEYGESEMSTLTVPATQKPEQVVNLRAVDVGFSYITITWDNVAGADAYRVYRDGVLLSEQTDTIYGDSRLTPETTYTYGVSAVNEIGETTATEITVSTIEFKLVTDRTQADVNYAKSLHEKGLPRMTAEELGEWTNGLKGWYDYRDLNRVGEAIIYVRDRLKAVGEVVAVEPKIDWTLNDLPTYGAIAEYLNNIEKLRSVMPVPIETPVSGLLLNYEEANDIERILEYLEILIDNIEQTYLYSGEIYAGEV